MGQGLGACIQKVNKVPKSNPRPLSHCWSQHGDRVPSYPPAQDSKELFALVPGTRSRRHSPRNAMGTPRATQPCHHLLQGDGKELGVGDMGTAHGRYWPSGTGEIEGVHQAPSLHQHSMGSH